MNNKIKLQYEEPKMCVAVFEAKDIIATSGFPGEIDPISNGEQQ